MRVSAFPPSVLRGDGERAFQSQIANLKSSIMRVLITAGPTREPIDPVRYVGNRSSGKMGAALASAARRAGHEVTLIVGPVSATMPPGVRRIDIETAAQMHAAVLREFPGHELLIMAAAVADFRPVRLESRKLRADSK